MDIQIRHIPDTADKWEVVRAISLVVHDQSFVEEMRTNGIQLVKGNMPLESMNFKVDLDMDENRGLRNKTTGTLSLCHWRIGELFLNRVSTDLPARVQGKKIKFHRKPQRPISDKAREKAKQTADLLEKTRFIDPAMQEKRETISSHLRDGFTTVRAMHVGFILKEGKAKIFSSEFKVQRYGQLWIEYDQKVFRILVRVSPPSSLLYHALKFSLSSESPRWTKIFGASSSHLTTSRDSDWEKTTEIHVSLHCHLYTLTLDSRF